MKVNGTEYQIVYGDGGSPPNADAPMELYTFLKSRGWEVVYGFGITHWKSRRHPQIHTWEQAMAIEFYEFITLGGR